MTNTSLEWTTVQKRVTDLTPNETNPRKISDKQMSDLKKSLEKFNLVEIPAIDFDNSVLAGHQRLKALELLGRGDEMIDVRMPNRKLTKEEVDRYLIGSNALGGDWDFDLLKDFQMDFLVDVGFDPIDLSSAWDIDASTKDESFNEDKELESIKQPVTQPGDLLILGNHRLICGDSTDP